MVGKGVVRLRKRRHESSHDVAKAFAAAHQLDRDGRQIIFHYLERNAPRGTYPNVSAPSLRQNKQPSTFRVASWHANVGGHQTVQASDSRRDELVPTTARNDRFDEVFFKFEARDRFNLAIVRERGRMDQAVLSKLTVIEQAKIEEVFAAANECITHHEATADDIHRAMETFMADLVMICRAIERENRIQSAGVVGPGFKKLTCPPAVFYSRSLLVDYTNYPQRPGKPICSFYADTGRCQFCDTGQACPADHPRHVSGLSEAVARRAVAALYPEFNETLEEALESGGQQARRLLLEREASFRQAFRASSKLPGTNRIDCDGFRELLHLMYFFVQNWERFESLQPSSEPMTAAHRLSARFRCETVQQFADHCRTFGLSVQASGVRSSVSSGGLRTATKGPAMAQTQLVVRFGDDNDGSGGIEIDLHREFSRLTNVGTTPVTFSDFCSWCARSHLKAKLASKGGAVNVQEPAEDRTSYVKTNEGGTSIQLSAAAQIQNVAATQHNPSESPNSDRSVHRIVDFQEREVEEAVQSASDLEEENSHTPTYDRNFDLQKPENWRVSTRPVVFFAWHLCTCMARKSINLTTFAVLQHDSWVCKSWRRCDNFSQQTQGW
eukprot:SAG31_NODE_488_length_14964_cov_56.443458_13_plen_611_part_00